MRIAKDLQRISIFDLGFVIRDLRFASAILNGFLHIALPHVLKFDL